MLGPPRSLMETTSFLVSCLTIPHHFDPRSAPSGCGSVMEAITLVSSSKFLLTIQLRNFFFQQQVLPSFWKGLALVAAPSLWSLCGFHKGKHSLAPCCSTLQMGQVSPSRTAL